MTENVAGLTVEQVKILAKAAKKAENAADFVQFDFSGIPDCVKIDAELREAFAMVDEIKVRHAAIHSAIVIKMGPALSPEIRARLHMDDKGKLSQGYGLKYGHRGGTAVAAVKTAKAKSGGVVAVA